MNNGLIYKFVAYKKNMDNRFTDIIQLIKQSQANAIRAVNAELINLYLEHWRIY